MNDMTPTADADADALAALLARLRSDGGAHAYEELRRRLILFFHVPAAADAEHLADVTLERIGRRLAEGVDVANVRAYALGVARLLLAETRARHARQRRAERDPLFADSLGNDRPDVPDATLRALHECLSTVEPDGRELILAYYGADGGERIRLRQALAARRSMSLNALRNRALRLRAALERCLRRRLVPEDARDD